MDKIGIITLNGYKNYGNRLQNYALQEAIKSLDYQVETILVDTGTTETKRVSHKKKVNELPKKIISRLLNMKNKKQIIIRTNRFKDFSKNYIHETSYNIAGDADYKEDLLNFKAFVTGSDQVWNPYYINGSSAYFLSFAPIEKRISYAASFGISHIPNEFQKEYKENLDKIMHLSVREDQGAEIIKDLTGRKAQVVVDPTMLLTKEQWRSISSSSNSKPTKPYLLTYFLGEISRSSQTKIEKLAKDKKLEIVNLANLSDLQRYTSDPSEFLDFIDSAEIFCTDSFHGVVFSILFEKTFIVFERTGSLPSMYSRLETLLSKFNLKQRMEKNVNFDDYINEIDYSEVEGTLKKEREKAYAYLKEALK
ncbi:polysaccharide pyruvyl transferase family protein [Alkalihalobacillus sp. NPDC078783]